MRVTKLFPNIVAGVNAYHYCLFNAWRTSRQYFKVLLKTQSAFLLNAVFHYRNFEHWDKPNYH